MAAHASCTVPRNMDPIAAAATRLAPASAMAAMAAALVESVATGRDLPGLRRTGMLAPDGVIT